MKIKIIAPLSLALFYCFSVPSHAVVFTVLHHFNGADGNQPNGMMAMDGAGNLYGSTYVGGKHNFGTLFQLRKTRFRTLVHFNNTNGASPWGALLADGDGNLYGTTLSGGPANAGTVFSWDRELGLKTIKNFAGGVDGLQPWGGLTRDAAGNLYGSTFYGGDIKSGGLGYGTLFKIGPTGIFTQLHSFTNTDGYGPTNTLVRVKDRLYGGTAYTISGTSGPGWAGSPFVIDVDGAGFSTITPTDVSYNFMGGLIKDNVGNLWGTVMRAGKSGLGGIFKIDLATHTYQLVYQFNGKDGAFPTDTLVMDAAGNFYGTTKGNGTSGSEGSGLGGYGTVFKFSPSTNTLTTLHTFTGPDGKNPYSGLLIDPSNVYLYGVAPFGGKNNLGIVYRIKL